jgi:proteasome lid subunit RPN8/RPN11
MPITYPEGGLPGTLISQTEKPQRKPHLNSFRVQLVPLRPSPKMKINRPLDVASYAKEMEDYDREFAKILHLNTKNEVIGTETISIGSIDQSIVHPRETVKGAILNNTTNVIFIHNHPSENCDPSREDIEISSKLKSAFSLVGIKMLDSIIIGKGCYYSLQESGTFSVPVMREKRNGYGEQYKTAEPTPAINHNQISEKLEKISVSTSKHIHEYQVIGAATPMNGYLLAYHLTDNPDEVIRRLRADNIVAMNPYGDLGGGFYVSSVPQYWRARSSGKWEFARNLTREQRQRLVNVILSDPRYRKGGGYLTDFELERLRGDLSTYVNTGDLTFLVITGGQPYNVTVTEEIIRKAGAGIPSPREPGLVEVSLKGKFIDGQKLYGSPNYQEFLKAAKVRSRPGESEKNIINEWLNTQGHSGIFTKSGFSTNPEMVVWDRKAIVGIRKVI